MTTLQTTRSSPDLAGHIRSVLERSKMQDVRERPGYWEVRDLKGALDKLQDNDSAGLGGQLKLHEDWMRRGKKLFGKLRVPLQFLHTHMKYVEARNRRCFDTFDVPHMPVEPISRDRTPDDDSGSQSVRNLVRPERVFCICRSPQDGVMVECVECREWYHRNCLKIVRGKLKAMGDYICPICNWEVEIPRSSARPELQDLQKWLDEVPGLPFRPDEEECLVSIVKTAKDFRQFLRPYVSSLVTSLAEMPTQRFYLRKLEGAEVLLSDETTFFRLELHQGTQAPIPRPPAWENLPAQPLNFEPEPEPEPTAPLWPPTPPTAFNPLIFNSSPTLARQLFPPFPDLRPPSLYTHGHAPGSSSCSSPTIDYFDSSQSDSIDSIFADFINIDGGDGGMLEVSG
ncbi:MAG: hypothetical protein M1840_002028 [Geoglossum simile]|nr:MAG: hypothetical protein M1840_002028 [Geoglossum simile]